MNVHEGGRAIVTQGGFEQRRDHVFAEVWPRPVEAWARLHAVFRPLSSARRVLAEAGAKRGAPGVRDLLGLMAAHRPPPEPPKAAV